jgi:hypothetical protein
MCWTRASRRPSYRRRGEEADPDEKDKVAAGAPHVLITRTPDGRLTFLQAIGSRRKAAIAVGLPTVFTGYLITDGYTGYQHLLSRLAGIQQCAAHVIRRCRAVTRLGPAACSPGPATSSPSCARPIRRSRRPAPLMLSAFALTAGRQYDCHVLERVVETHEVRDASAGS